MGRRTALLSVTEGAPALPCTTSSDCHLPELVNDRRNWIIPPHSLSFLSASTPGLRHGLPMRTLQHLASWSSGESALVGPSWFTEGQTPEINASYFLVETHNSVAHLPACSEGPGRIQLMPSEAASFLEHSSSLSLFPLCSWPCSLAQVPPKNYLPETFV